MTVSCVAMIFSCPVMPACWVAGLLVLVVVWLFG
jgi:hypothetical protein